MVLDDVLVSGVEESLEAVVERRRSAFNNQFTSAAVVCITRNIVDLLVLRAKVKVRFGCTDRIL